MNLKAGNLAALKSERPDAHSITAGISLATGLTRLWIVSDVLLFFTAQPFSRPGRLAFILIVSIGITLAWTSSPLFAALACWRIYALEQSLKRVRRPSQTAAVVIVFVALQSALALTVFHDHRPIIFSGNSQQLAASSFSIFGYAGIIPALGIGASGARLPLLAGAALAVLSRFNLRICGALALAVLLFALSAGFTPRRTSTAGNAADFKDRAELVTLESLDSASAESILTHQLAIRTHRPELACDHPSRSWTVAGYGYGSYNRATCLDMPHNVFVLAWYELGAFSLPLFAALALALRRMPLHMTAPALIYLFFIDDMYAEPYGMYASAVFVFQAHKLKLSGMTLFQISRILWKRKRVRVEEAL